MAASNSRVRKGLLALPLAGLVFVTTVPLRGEGRGGTVGDPAAFAAHVGTGRYLAGYLGNTVAFALLLFAVVALGIYLGDHGHERLSTAGTIGTVAGIALVLPLFGILAFADRAVGQAYLAAPSATTIDVANRFFAGPLLVLAAAAGTLYIVGFVLFAVAVWRTPTLPRWAAVLLVMAPPVLSRPPSLAAEVVASALLLAAGLGLALAVRRDLATPATEPLRPAAATA